MEKEPKVIFEDETIVVIDKPSGLIVNKSRTAKSVTLQHWLEERYGFKNVDTEAISVNDSSEDAETDVEVEAEQESGDDFESRSGIVHRLDKDTSGVLVVAKTPDAFISLQKQFKGRKTQKEYYAVVHGIVKDEYIEVNAPIKRSPRNPMKLAVVSDGREALTEFEKIKEIHCENENYTVVKALPKTGRTHQIRVHLAALNHPIAGDVIYCTAHFLEKDAPNYQRLMLHAHKLGFYHPLKHELIEFISPLPSEFGVM